MAPSSKIVYPPGCKEINEDLPTDDLIRRLKDIAMAFQQMSQEEDNSCYVPLALYLATDFFLEHSSRDVRLLVACAIADVFRVYAPNAPYKNPSLIKRIFLFFIQQLKGLQDPKDPTFKRYFYLLENLAWVKSFNICIELDDSQFIFSQLFSLIFKIVNENHSEKVKNFMLDMLTPLIIEADAVSTKLIEIILWQLIEPRKSQNKQACWLATQILKKANKTIEPYLVTYFNNAITNGIHANAGDLSDEEDEDSGQRSSMKSRNKGSNQTMSTSVTQLCELLYELNQICPSVMDGILPQLEFKIRSNEERERCEFTKLLARLFSDKNSRLAEQYPELWKSFLGRFRDISVTVRMRCVQYSMHFLINHPELREDITEQLKQRQHDPDENVRYEVVMAIIAAAKKGIEHINEDLLSFVKERTLDKKFKIRREALYGMAQLYKQYNITLLGDNDDDGRPAETTANNAALRMLNWIKNKCLHNYYQTQLDDRLLVERILHTCLIPYNLPLSRRMKVLYTFYATIDSYAARAFNELLRQQQSVRKQVKEVLDLLKAEKSEDRDQQLKVKIQQCAKNLPEPVKADEYLTKLCRNLELNPTLRQHMETIVNSTSYPQFSEDGTLIPPPPCASIESSVKEVLKSLGFPVQTNSFYVIIKQLMERIAPVMIDYQGLVILFEYVADSLLAEGDIDVQLGLENSSKRGLQLIHALSTVFPAIFYGREIFTDYLLPFLWKSVDQPEISEIVLQIFTNVGGTQGPFQKSQANNHQGSNNLHSIPWWAADEDVVPKLIDKFVLKASTTKQAKYSIQCLNAVVQDDEEKRKMFAQILDTIKDTGLAMDCIGFRTHLVTIGMIATCGGHHFFPKLLRSIIQKAVVQNLLMKDSRTPEEVQSAEKREAERAPTDSATAFEFCAEEVKCKIEGIKLMARWLYGLKLNTLIAPPDKQQEYSGVYQNAAMNTMRIMTAIVQNNGDLNEKGLAGTTIEKARLKLAAANAMLKIVGNDSITTTTGSQGDTTIHTSSSTSSTLIIPTQWHALATVLLDKDDYVREKFALKLHKGLISLSLGLEFLAILCLGGFYEPKNQFHVKLRNYLMLNVAKRRDLVKSKSVTNLKAVLPDCVMPYVIHLLAYMPFYTQYDNIEQLEIVKSCLWFVIEAIVMKNDQFSFSFYKKTFENIKTCVDRVSASLVQDTDENGTSTGPTMSTMTNYKIYCACDLALGLIMSKTQNFLLKDFPVQPSLPGKYYMVSPSAANNNQRCYLPAEMQFPPPKRCNLEAEVLGKITKNFNSQSNAQGKNRQSKNQSNNSNSGQVVVISSDNVIEEGLVIEQETMTEPKHTSTPIVNQTRSRKQDLTVIAPHEGDKEEKRSRRKQDITPIPSTRPTRASSRNIANVIAAEAREDYEDDEDEEKDEKNEDEEETIEEGQEEVVESVQEDNGEVIVELESRRGPAKRGRKLTKSDPPTRQNVKSEKGDKSDEDSASPVRKSARIARKPTCKKSPSPEPAFGRGRKKTRGRK